MKHKQKSNLGKKIIAGLGAIILTGCSSLQKLPSLPPISLKPTGNVELAYVPIRIDDEVVRRQLMSEIGVGLGAKVQAGPLEDVELTMGLRQRVFVTPMEIMGYHWISPTRQEYGLKMDLGYENLKFFIEHYSTHPVGEEEFSIFDEERDKEYWIGMDSLTRIGMRWKF